MGSRAVRFVRPVKKPIGLARSAPSSAPLCPLCLVVVEVRPRDGNERDLALLWTSGDGLPQPAGFERDIQSSAEMNSVGCPELVGFAKDSELSGPGQRRSASGCQTAQNAGCSRRCRREEQLSGENLCSGPGETNRSGVRSTSPRWTGKGSKRLTGCTSTSIAPSFGISLRFLSSSRLSRSPPSLLSELRLTRSSSSSASVVRRASDGRVPSSTESLSLDSSV